MPKKRKRKPSKEAADPINISIKALIGSLVNIIIFFALSAAFSFICLKADLDEALLKYFVFAAAAISGLIGGFTAVRPIRKNGLLIGGACALPAFLIIFLISSILSRTGIAVSGWIAALIMTLASALGGILSANRRK